MGLSGSSHLAVWLIGPFIVCFHVSPISVTNVNIINSYSKAIWLQNLVISKCVPHIKKLRYTNILICGMPINSAPTHFRIILRLAPGFRAGGSQQWASVRDSKVAAHSAIIRRAGGSAPAPPPRHWPHCAVLVALAHARCDFNDFVPPTLCSPEL